ncbi:MAG: hypothetical protein J0H00_01800 [Burkholderiales bacterium]|nr:hypothetical protein [Burkholderiales bacterium]OJX07488.1 MAG: hypothetical protein BGO72_08540 [Burkholderiales bacterium 70-64]
MSTPIRIPVEVRFPLDLATRIAPIHRLYEDAKLDTWSPEGDIPWSAFDPAALPAAQRDAARTVWSRRTWLEYTGIAETPALLLRFCMERAREVDAKYFLTVRNTEEAMLVECFDRYAKSLGPCLDRPTERGWEAVINRGYYRDALNAEVDLDAYVAVHCAIEDGLELELFRAYLANAREAVARKILERSVRAKARHAEFGWRYLAKRSGEFDSRQRAAIAEAASAWLKGVAFAGYHIPSLSTTIDGGTEKRAQALAAESGLGAATAPAEEEIFRAYLASARSRLRGLGLELPALPHPRLGEL